MYAPIVLFVYNRPYHTRRTLEALSRNELATQSDLFIFADGAKENALPEQLLQIEETRKVIRERQWCKNVEIIESSQNKGLAKSIIEGVTKIVNQYGKIIVLEDDLLTGKYFLNYMNEALDKYENKEKVWHITSWRDPVETSNPNSSFFYPVMDCWGWATWANRWQNYKKDYVFYKKKFSRKMRKAFNIDGTDKGMWQQILDNEAGKINTWAIFWYATIFLHNGLCLAPCSSLVRNIGFDNSGEHCGANSFQEISQSIDVRISQFPNAMEVNKNEYEKIKSFMRKKNNPFTLNRLKAIVKRFYYPIYYTVKFRNAVGYIFMLHRVSDIEPSKLFPNENMKVSPAYLDNFIRQAKKRFDIISISEIEKYLQTSTKKKFIVFTMDDGYKDNFTEALPVFKKHNVPFTIFVATNFPEKNAVLWWYELEDLLLANDEIILSDGSKYNCTTKSEKERAFLDIRLKILALNQEDLVNELNDMFCNYKINWSAKCEELCLSWNDLRKLKEEPLVTIAAHTAHHFNLKALKSEDAVTEEIQKGLDLFNEKLGIQSKFFAYPFGSDNEVSQREVNILEKMSFSSAFLAYGGVMKDGYWRNKRFALPRIMLTEDFESRMLK